MLVKLTTSLLYNFTKGANSKSLTVLLNIHVSVKTVNLFGILVVIKISCYRFLRDKAEEYKPLWNVLKSAVLLIGKEYQNL